MLVSILHNLSSTVRTGQFLQIYSVCHAPYVTRGFGRGVTGCCSDNVLPCCAGTAAAAAATAAAAAATATLAVKYCSALPMGGHLNWLLVIRLSCSYTC